MAGKQRGTPENLKSFGTGDIEKERKIHSKGGKAGAETKRRRKAMKEQLKLLLELPLENPKLKEQIKNLGVNDKDINNQLAVCIALFNQALKGNTKAYELIRDTIGEKPIEKQEIKQVSTEWFK